MDQRDIENLEINLLLQAICERYGYDFRHYTKATIRRRLRHFLSKTDFQQISDLISALLYNEELTQQLIRDFSITVTEMFRNPEAYLAIRQQVIPYLKTYPFIKLWHAGCATGEEVYSTAIILNEEKLDKRITIFATDFNDDALQKAREGIYPQKQIQQYTRNYQQAGGLYSFTNYYHAQYDHARMNSNLKENITFANHNLVTDGVFSEMHLVFCRNVLIYFDRTLQDRVLQLLYDSLAHGGFLCLGANETIEFSSVKDKFQTIDEKNKIYQKQTI